MEYTLEQVSKHNTPNDCWMIIHGKVYDVTSFLDDHPGGSQYLTDNAGIDATDAFLDVGHSADAVKMLDKYEIGICIDCKPSYAAVASIPPVQDKPMTSSSYAPSTNTNDSKKDQDKVDPAIVGSVVVGAISVIGLLAFGAFKLLSKNNK
ncbi:hypothetical protein CYY_002376 [Polysphondylium violaceum]|uniref:Cytochrome b5 heme-binding domain-containing protein n=1 Tax=Polysphondylium violaceum TaxID=133409 RepID=A0A8J4V0V5_9MYCE|nr:hypothetical protein CYY_002376 [Polysphondylium violaceum]